MTEDRLVQNRDCPKCGVAQTRRASKDGVFRRWTRCDCPPKTKRELTNKDIVTFAGSDKVENSPPPVSGYLHRDTVQRLDKK